MTFPVFDAVTGKGSKADYGIAGFLVLRLTGWRFPGDPSPTPPCISPNSCVAGTVVRYTYDRTAARRRTGPLRGLHLPRQLGAAFMFKRQKLIGIVASLVLAGVGTILLASYVRGAEQRATGGEARVGVLVVSEAIPEGTAAGDMAGRVRTESVPVKVAAEGAIANLGSVAGLVTGVDLLPGEQLVKGRFATAVEAGKVAVPPNSLEVTVLLSAVQAAGGKVRVGDSVAVLVSFEDPSTTHLFLQKVPVTGVRTEGGEPVTSKPEAAGPVGNLFVTLALDAPSVERVVFAAEHGSLWLAGQPPNSDEGGTQVQTRAGMNL